jgi:hypothetical protein
MKKQFYLVGYRDKNTKGKITEYFFSYGAGEFSTSIKDLSEYIIFNKDQAKRIVDDIDRANRHFDEYVDSYVITVPFLDPKDCSITYRKKKGK